MYSELIQYKQTSFNDIQLELEVLEDMLAGEREERRKGFDGLHFLIADENSVFAEVIKKSLMIHFKKSDIVYVNKYEDVIKQLNRVEPDVLITDQHMPGSESLNLIKTLQSKAEFKSIKILMMTEKQAMGEKSAADEFPLVQGILVKPFTAEQLIEKVQNILSDTEKKN